MSDYYEHRQFEERWLKRWQDCDVFRWRNDPEKPKFYVLEMFPYTSGRLHMGHVRNYTMGDILARVQRARGYDVLYPMGWDAFGLPAENAAVARGLPAQEFTAAAITNMKVAMSRVGLSYDWSCEINTADSEYIKSQQQLFLNFYQRNLVYRDSTFVNWCDKCATVLANEQAAGGTCWRCHSSVNKRKVQQWFMNIRAYAEELLQGLDELKGWPDSVKNIQRGWIGRSCGTEISFRIEGEADTVLSIYTTRPDTLFGCTFVVLALEHDLLDRITLPSQHREQVLAFRERMLLKSVEERTSQEQDKLGIFTGRYAINPINGDRVPIWVANYVLMEYGTGAIMAVPAHDQRDFEFARQYAIPVRRVILGKETDRDAPLDAAYEGDGTLVDSGRFQDLRNEAGGDAITDWLVEHGVGRRSVQYRLQNWSVSRQRYWGNPIPIVYCPQCGPQPVPEGQLPVLLPQDARFGMGGSPLEHSPSFMATTCPVCGRPARRDPDTMDTFVDSSWYFLRFTGPHLIEPFDRDVADRMLPVDAYIGGLEHATMHLMYARFFTKVLRDLGMLTFNEPFANLYNQGMVNDKFGRKQSKSVGNTVEPFDVVERYGADALRLCLMFATAHDAPINWDDEGPLAARQYLSRLWRLADRLRTSLATYPGMEIDPDHCTGAIEQGLRRAAHETIKKVTTDVLCFQFNTAIAALMKLTNTLYSYPAEAHAQPAAAAYRLLVRMAAPVAPFICEEIWSRVGDGRLLVDQPWPGYDPSAFIGATKTISVQVNGKFVVAMDVPQEADGDGVLQLALTEVRVSNRIKGRPVRKVIHVANRLVNIIAS